LLDAPEPDLQKVRTLDDICEVTERCEVIGGCAPCSAR
jgi:hypothetical protein